MKEQNWEVNKSVNIERISVVVYEAKSQAKHPSHLCIYYTFYFTGSPYNSACCDHMFQSKLDALYFFYCFNFPIMPSLRFCSIIFMLITAENMVCVKLCCQQVCHTHLLSLSL